MSYGKNLLIAVDQLVNTLTGRLAGRNAVQPGLPHGGRRAPLAHACHRWAGHVVWR